MTHASVLVGAPLLALPTFLFDFGFDPWIVAILVPLVLFGLDRREQGSRRWSGVSLAISLGVLALGGASLSRVIGDGITNPPEFDFLAFWIPARVAALHLNFYDPASYHAVASHVGADFRAEILRTGFWYPPPTMFVAYPFGMLDVHAAARVWYGVQLAALAGCWVLLWKAFLPRSGVVGLAACGALIVLLRSTFMTFGFAQTNFLALLALLGFWHGRSRARAGVWLALAIVIKPFLLAVLAFLLVRRRWAAIATTLGTLVTLVLLAAVAFGAATTLGYFTTNPWLRLPPGVFSEDLNQSLTAAMFRWGGLRTPSPEAARRLALVAAIAIALPTTWAAPRRSLDDALLLVLILAAGLIVYPLSLEHYSVVLLLPILAAWSPPCVAPGNRVALGLVTTLVFVLVATGSGWVLVAYGALWVGAIIVSGLTIPLRTREG